MLVALVLVIVLCASGATALDTAAVTLQSAYESAPAGGGYDRILELEHGRVYTGGLLIGPTWDEDRSEFLDLELGHDVLIDGNGAVLDLQGQMICISFCDNRLDIQDCIIINGGIRYRGDNTPDVDRVPRGTVRYCTFYRPHDYAVRLQGAGAGVVCERNIVVDAVDTGLDYVIWTSEAGVNLPTGLAFGLSVQIGSFGMPQVRDNWTWFSDPQINAEALHHYCFL